MTPHDPLRDLTTEGIDEHWPQLEQRSDRGLAIGVMGVLADPPEAAADSFVLHAPLELMARTELLPLVDPTARDTARRRIVEIAAQWNALGPHLGHPSTPASSSLPDAIAAGDLDETDRALVDLAARATVDRFVTTAASTLLSHLGGAAHLCIYLDQLTRVPRPPRTALTMGRALMRDLARHPDWSLRWIDDPPPAGHRPTRTFTDVLADPPSAGEPSSNFIYPTMNLVDATGLAADLLAGPAADVPLDEARRQLLRIAAMSMLQDDPASAPYGWSHCLTMPQATLAVAPRLTDPRRAVAIAATYVLGFRSTLSTAAIDLAWRPGRPTTALDEHVLIEAEIEQVVAAAWHTDDPDRVERILATVAASHPDAHLAKYTLACLHAAHDDPEAAPLFRAAAARLARWWRDHDDGVDLR